MFFFLGDLVLIFLLWREVCDNAEFVVTVHNNILALYWNDVVTRVARRLGLDRSLLYGP